MLCITTCKIQCQYCFMVLYWVQWIYTGLRQITDLSLVHTRMTAGIDFSPATRCPELIKQKMFNKCMDSYFLLKKEH